MENRQKQAANPRLVARLIVEEDFQVNGCKVMSTKEATDFFNDAHAVLSFVGSYVFEDEVSSHRPNDNICAGALNAVQTLLEMGMWQLEHDQLAGRT